MTATSHACPEHLKSSDACVYGRCPENCADRFKMDPESGRWYITMGHAGYNSPANNFDGYASKKAAEAANRRYQISGRTRGLKSGSILLCTKCSAICHFETHCEGQPTRKLTEAEGKEWIERGRFASFVGGR